MRQQKDLRILINKLKHNKSPKKQKHKQSPQRVKQSPQKIKAKGKPTKVENSSKSNDSLNQNEKSIELGISLSMNKEQSIKEKKVMEDTINDLNQRIEHLVADLKYQMLTFTKMDNARK